MNDIKTPLIDRNQNFGRLFLILLIVGAISSCSRTTCSSRITEVKPPPPTAPTIRILLFENLDSVHAEIDGEYELKLIDGSKSSVVKTGYSFGPTRILYAGSDIVIEGVMRTQCSIELVPKRGIFEVNGHRYRGTLRIDRSADKLLVINSLDIDGYLCGVLPSEVYPSWPRAALEAQAIAARTYAISKFNKRQAEPFHVRSSVLDQKYGGLDKEDVRTTEAVLATAGVVLTYNGKNFPAYYHSCCSGFTADGRTVFGEDSQLRSVQCSYCGDAPKFKWTTRCALSEARTRLSVPDLAGLSTENVGLDGRVGQVSLHRTNGQPLVMAGTAFRDRMGLYSTRFEISADGPYFVFHGNGWGHGVGLCQWGARGMAQHGMSAQDILQKYYPGATLGKTY